MSDKKDAVNIGVTLSGQLITAALAMIAVIGTFATFIIDKREVGFWYYLVVGIAFLAFVMSIVFGGKGINEARNKGFAGNWNITDTKTHFDRQAKACAIGILFFIISVFCGKQKAEEQKPALSGQKQELQELRKKDSLTSLKLIRLEWTVDSLKKLKPINHVPCCHPHTVKRCHCR